MTSVFVVAKLIQKVTEAYLCDCFAMSTWSY